MELVIYIGITVIQQQKDTAGPDEPQMLGSSVKRSFLRRVFPCLVSGGVGLNQKAHSDGGGGRLQRPTKL